MKEQASVLPSEGTAIAQEKKEVLVSFSFDLIVCLRNLNIFLTLE